MEDTIAAISTAYGEGGIGIVRVSGSGSLPLLEKIFIRGEKKSEEESVGERSRTSGIAHRQMMYGHVVDPADGHVIDECMAVFFRGPRSYTTEDMAEIYCHGSMVSLKNTLALLLRSGARPAEPGEFTKRAFLNGRIDLAQAEAVIDLVKAKTDSGYDMAVAQLEGELSRRVKDIRKELMELLVEMVVNIDYPEEDIEEITLKMTEDKLSLIGDMIDELVENSSSGRMIRDGINIAIAGRPNVGKSSLMNAMLRENRAIVTEVPGTTRDTIEESASIRGIPVVMVDTAGIHDTEDKVERLGIERSRKAFHAADFILLVLDGSRELADEDRELLEEMQPRADAGACAGNGGGAGACTKPFLVVINKSDLEEKLTEEDVKKILPGCDIVHTSMVTDQLTNSDGGGDQTGSGIGRTGDRAGSGIGEIEDRIEALVFGGGLRKRESLLVSNVRHIDLLRRAGEDVARGKAMAAGGEPLDIIEVDARAAFDSLGEIIGETVSDQVLDEVFSRFCLGK